MTIRANYHTHSTLCDGTSTLEEHAREALRLGFTHLGFSGHMDADVHMDFDRYLAEVRSVQEKYRDRMEILCGVELDNLYDPKYAGMADYVIGSTHFLDVEYERPLSVDDTPEDFLLLLNGFYRGDWRKMCRDYYEIEAGIWRRFDCTFIGHFDLVAKFNDELHVIDEEDPVYLGYASEAMEALADRGLVFEINTRNVHKGRLFPGKRLLKRLHEMGGEVILSSDAHCCTELNKGFDTALRAARECGFDHVNILVKGGSGVAFKQIGI